MILSKGMSYVLLYFTLAYSIPLDIQDLQPNATIFIPSVTGVGLSPGEIVIASAITVLPGDTTVIQLVDHNPTPSVTDQDPITLTIAVSPTGFQSDLSLPEEGIISYEETCFLISDGEDSCSEVGVFNVNGTIITTQRSNTVPTIGFPVVALNFDQSSSSSSSTMTTTSSTLASPTTPASVIHTNTPTFRVMPNPVTTITSTSTAATIPTSATAPITQAAIPPASAATKGPQSRIRMSSVLGLITLIGHIAYQWL